MDTAPKRAHSPDLPDRISAPSHAPAPIARFDSTGEHP